MQLTLLWIAAAVNQREDVASLELEAYLHSRSTGHSGVDGVVVSKGDSLPEPDYLAVLRNEKNTQDLRVLSEIGFSEVEFSSEPGLRVVPLEFSDAWMDQSVTKFFDALKLDLEIGASLAADDLYVALNSLGQRRKTQALRRLNEFAFFLRRFGEVKDRFVGPHDISAGDRHGRMRYANQVRTRSEEKDIAYKVLSGRHGGLSNYGVLEIWGEVAQYVDNDLTSALSQDTSQRTSYKLIIDSESPMLERFFEAYRGDVAHKLLPQETKSQFEEFVTRLMGEYKQQEAAYADYNSHLGELKRRDTARGTKYAGDLLSKIRLAQDYRRSALHEYESFKIPFKKDVEYLFHFYTADPESRGFSADGHVPAQFPFDSDGRVKATSFIAEKLIPCFEAVDVALYYETLYDVVVGPQPKDSRQSGMTANFGSSMFLYNDDGAMLRELRDTVAHECGHVFNLKAQEKFVDKLRQRAGEQHRLQLGAFSEEVRKAIYSQQNGADLIFSDYVSDRTEVVDTLGALVEIWGAANIDGLAPEILNLPDGDKTQVIELNNVYSKAVDDFGKNERYIGVVDPRELPSFFTRYASMDADEDAAELICNIANKARRAGLYRRMEDDPDLRTKVEGALHLFRREEKIAPESEASMEKRVSLAKAWAGELDAYRAATHSRLSESRTLRPITAVVFTGNAESSFNSIDKAEAYVEHKIFEGRPTMLLQIDMSLDYAEILLNHGLENMQRGEITVFGAKDNIPDDIRAVLVAVLEVEGRNIYGQLDQDLTPNLKEPVESWNLDVKHHGCQKFRFP